MENVTDLLRIYSRKRLRQKKFTAIVSCLEKAVACIWQSFIKCSVQLCILDGQNFAFSKQRALNLESGNLEQSFNVIGHFSNVIDGTVKKLRIFLVLNRRSWQKLCGDFSNFWKRQRVKIFSEILFKIPIIFKLSQRSGGCYKLITETTHLNCCCIFFFFFINKHSKTYYSTMLNTIYAEFQRKPNIQWRIDNCSLCNTMRLVTLIDR